MTKNFRDVKVGDKITRMLAGAIPMKLVVSEVTDTLILTAAGWKFDRETGAEVDEDLDWGPPPKMTGSYLVKEMEGKEVQLGDFLTDEQIREMVHIFREGGRAKDVHDKVILPNMETINRKLGQENNPMFLAYVCEHAYGEYKRRVQKRAN